MINIMRQFLKVGFILPIGLIIPVAQAALVSEGHAAGAQCGGADVNNSGYEVGNCLTVGSGPTVAWLSVSPGTEVPLLPLVSGQSCGTGGIANDGTILGQCMDGNDKQMGVKWNASTPTISPVVLQPLSLLGLIIQTRSSARMYNQNGAVIGDSISADETSTPVIWLPGSNTATQLAALSLLSTLANCGAVDVDDSIANGGRPNVLLACPNANGTVTAKVATATGLLNAYVTNARPVPAGYSYCSAVSINNAQQIAGTCHTLAPDLPRATFWRSMTDTGPAQTTGTFRNGSVALNNSGSVLVAYKDGADGRIRSAFWKPLTGALTLIPSLPGGAYSVGTVLADDDTVIGVSDLGDGNHAGFYWTPSGGTVSAGFEGGGPDSELNAISENGKYVAGSARNSAHVHDAVFMTIP